MIAPEPIIAETDALLGACDAAVTAARGEAAWLDELAEVVAKRVAALRARAAAEATGEGA